MTRGGSAADTVNSSEDSVMPALEVDTSSSSCKYVKNVRVTAVLKVWNFISEHLALTLLRRQYLL